MTSQHGQHGKPAIPILHWPSEFCRFHLVMNFAGQRVSGREGRSGGGGGGGGGCFRVRDCLV